MEEITGEEDEYSGTETEFMNVHFHWGFWA
jgi:hypothetical protein